MKLPKCLIIAMCILFIASSFFVSSETFARKKHDEYMIDVLFKYFKNVENDPKILNEIEALECASYLAIDQFNNTGKDYLDFLLDYGVKNIPKNIEEISFIASGSNHRSYTHRGWNFHYTGIAQNVWPVRKMILLNTADKIFDFEGDEKKKDSFCALIYYIHIIGDHIHDTSYKVLSGYKMEIGGRRDREDIIDELLKHISILFKDQKNTHKYRNLIAKLELYNGRIEKLVNSNGGINTDEKFHQKKQYTEKVMELLTMYIPEMLKDEKFFYDVFYET